MAKTTKHGGASIHVYEPARTKKGGEQPSPGNSSATSTVKPPKSSGPSKRPRRKPARTTEHRSSPDLGGSSTAPSTATSGPETDEIQPHSVTHELGSEEV